MTDEITEEYKEQAMKEFAKITGEGALKMFMMMGLKTHMEFQMNNEVTGDEFVFTFQTLSEFKRRFKEV